MIIHGRFLTRMLLLLVIVLGLVLPPAAQSQLPEDQLPAFYYPLTHSDDQTTPADIVLQDGFGRIVIFEILNLTPYPMYFTAATLEDQTDRDRHTAKAFMFAPTGIPDFIPPGTTDPRGLQGIPGTHPRTFVLSWNDGPGIVEMNLLNWVAEDVDYITCTDPSDKESCTSYKQDVYLGLWLSRLAPPDPLGSGGFAAIMAIVDEALALGGLIEPWNPAAWYVAFSGTYHLATDEPTFPDEQMKLSDGAKLYVSTYTVPDFDRECFQKNNLATWQLTGHYSLLDQYMACTPGTMVGENTDGYKAQWAVTDSGGAPAELVVLTSVLRGRKDPLGEHWLTLGSVAHVMVTVMTAKQYDAAHYLTLPHATAGAQPGARDLYKEKVVKEVNKFREKYGIEGRRAVLSVIAELDPEQRLSLKEAVFTLREGDPVTKEQEKFLLDLLKQGEQVIRESGKED